MVTLVTLAVTHHSSRLDPSVVSHDLNDNTAALASMTHPIVPPTDTPQQARAAEMERAREEAKAKTVASGERARMEGHRVHAKQHEAHAEKKASAAVDAGDVEGGSSGSDATFTEPSMKQKVLEEKMGDEGYVKKLVKKASAVATLAQSETDTESPSPPPPPDPVVKAQYLSDREEPQPLVDLETAPKLKTKDDEFPDASWATDDYRTPLVSTKDPGALNRLDPVAGAPGPIADKTSDQVMKKMLKKIDDSKERLAEKAVEDDGAFNETKFIDELVEEDIVLAPDEEPESSLRTSGGNYLDGGFDEDDMARILSDDTTMDADDRNATNPTLEGEDVVANVKEEVPMAAPFDEEYEQAPAPEEAVVSEAAPGSDADDETAGGEEAPAPSAA